MPIPSPKDGETRKEFLSRCMGNEVMVSEYEDNKQRYAVCNSQWRRRNQKKGGGKSGEEEKRSKETREKEGIMNEQEEG